MERLIYYRNIEELPPAPICNIILNGRLVFDEFLMSILELIAEKSKTTPERIYVETINSLKSNRNVVYKVAPKYSILEDDRLEFVTMCNTSELEKNIILYNLEKISNFSNKSIRLKDIKDLYINNFALRKINNLTLYSEYNLLKELYKKDLSNKNLKSLTREGKKIKERVLALKNFINYYSFLREKDFENYILWGE